MNDIGGMDMNVFVKAVHSDKAPKALGPYSQATTS